MKRLLVLLALLVPTLASAQVAPYPFGVAPPIFGLPASSVNGGGTFTGQLFGPGTSCATPAYAFTGSVSTGLGSDVANAWCLSANGTAILRGTATAVTSTVPIVLPVGSNTAPSLAKVGELGTGIYFSGASTIAFATAAAGTTIAQFSANEWDFLSNSAALVFGATPDTTIGRLAANTAYLPIVGRVNGVVSEGLVGVPVVAKVGRITAQSSNATIATLTTPAVDGSYEVSANMNVTASTTLITTLTCTYTDESNTARTMIFPVASLAGSFIAAGAITGAGATVWETPMMHIRVKASTAITILTSAGTFTGVTYTADAVIKQMK